MRPLQTKAGTALTEYVLLVTVISIILTVLSQGAQYECIKNFAGESQQCTSLRGSIQSAFASSVEEITFLLNLPF